MRLHRNGHAYRALEAVASGRKLRSGLPALERALAILESRGLITLFPRPALTAKGQRELQNSAALQMDSPDVRA